MHKINNSISTVILDEEKRSIKVIFDGLGTQFDYHDTFKIVTDVSKIHEVKLLEIIKSEFMDIEKEKFIMFIFQWYHNNQQYNRKNFKVLLMTKPAIAGLIKSEISEAWRKKHYPLSDFELSIVTEN